MSVFLPPGVDRAEMERAGQMILDDSGDRHLDENVYFGWFRPLAPNLVPDPDSEEGRRLEAKRQQWGGMSAWEILGTGGMTLTHKLLLLAEHHDLLFYTADKRLYDPEGLRWRVDNEGIGWRCGWVRWLTGSDDPDTYDDEDEEEPHYDEPLEPGPTLAHPLDEWALVYHDGAVVFVNAETVEQHDGYHWFNATTVDGGTFNLAWATETGTTHLLHGRPLLRDNPHATAILNPLGWGQNPPPTTPDTDIRIDPLDW